MASIIDRRSETVNLTNTDQYNRIVSDYYVQQNGDFNGTMKKYDDFGRIIQEKHVNVFSSCTGNIMKVSDYHTYEYSSDNLFRTDTFKTETIEYDLSDDIKKLEPGELFPISEYGNTVCILERLVDEDYEFVKYLDVK